VAANVCLAQLDDCVSVGTTTPKLDSKATDFSICFAHSRTAESDAVADTIAWWEMRLCVEWIVRDRYTAVRGFAWAAAAVRWKCS